jgi:hypothetical protein
MSSLRHALSLVLAFGLFLSSTVLSTAQNTPTIVESTKDFTDRASFDAANGPTTTIGFGGIREITKEFRSSRDGPIVVSGITFTTSTPETFVNVTRANKYSPSYTSYTGDFIVNSAHSSRDNELTIILPCPMRAIGMDFGGLGFQIGSQSLVPGSATITLSNGHVYPPVTLPTVGKTMFVGFASTTPITTLILETKNDSWVLTDVVVADCHAPVTGNQIETTPTSTPAPEVGDRQALLTAGRPIAIPADSPTETTTNDCVFEQYRSHPGLQATPLRKALDYLASLHQQLTVTPDGNWLPFAKTFRADSTFPNLYIPLRMRESSYYFTLSSSGLLSINETGSSDSLIAGSGMSQLTGSETWSATQTVDLTRGKDTLTFKANLAAKYIGGSQQEPGKATKCTVVSQYSGEYDAVDMITFAGATVNSSAAPTQDCTQHFRLVPGMAPKVTPLPMECQIEIEDDTIRIFSGNTGNEDVNLKPVAIEAWDPIQPIPGQGLPDEQAAIVQNMTLWEGTATYGSGADKVYLTVASEPPFPFPNLPWLDKTSKGLPSPYWQYDPLRDSPNLGIALHSDGRTLTHIDFTKGFVTYFGCGYQPAARGNQFRPDDPRHWIHTMATLTWSVHYAGDVLLTPGGVEVIFIQEAGSGVQSGDYKLDKRLPVVVEPLANCVQNHDHPQSGPTPPVLGNPEDLPRLCSPLQRNVSRIGSCHVFRAPNGPSAPAP